MGWKKVMRRKASQATLPRTSGVSTSVQSRTSGLPVPSKSERAPRTSSRQSSHQDWSTSTFDPWARVLEAIPGDLSRDTHHPRRTNKHPAPPPPRATHQASTGRTAQELNERLQKFLHLINDGSAAGWGQESVSHTCSGGTKGGTPCVKGAGAPTSTAQNGARRLSHRLDHAAGPLGDASRNQTELQGRVSSFIRCINRIGEPVRSEHRVKAWRTAQSGAGTPDLAKVPCEDDPGRSRNRWSMSAESAQVRMKSVACRCSIDAPLVRQEWACPRYDISATSSSLDTIDYTLPHQDISGGSEDHNTTTSGSMDTLDDTPSG